MNLALLLLKITLLAIDGKMHQSAKMLTYTESHFFPHLQYNHFQNPEDLKISAKFRIFHISLQIGGFNDIIH